MCDHGLLDADKLRASLDNAFVFAADEEEDPKREEAYANLKLVTKYIQTGQISY
jgi:hypothetical protein